MTAPHVPACQETLRNISAYLDGDLDASACDAIEQHSLECPGCAALLDGLRKTVGLCRQAANVELPEDVRERAKAAVRQLLDEPAAAPRSRSQSST
ncbi:MAG: zf-HC2 domain-containing protein [Acidobacteria bacterium]|nr:zf-HC2 domain-containing protein [Acidobacteriota bacterium]